MQTALHMIALCEELRHELIGGTIVATEFYRKERLAQLIVKREKTTWALVLSFHPSGYGCCLIPASKTIRPEKEKPWPFFGIDGFRIESIDQPLLDRIVKLTLSNEGKEAVLLLEALGPGGNLWLLDTMKKQAVLRHREFSPGDDYQLRPLERIDPRTIDAPSVAAVLSQHDLPSAVVLEKQLAGWNKTLAREVITRATAAAGSAETPASLADAVRQIAQRFTQSDYGYLYPLAGGIEVYPFKLSSTTVEAEKYKTLSLAVWEMMSRRADQTGEADEQKRTIDALTKAATKLRKRIEKLAGDIAAAGQFEQYRKLGELLQINQPSIKRGMSSITVIDEFDSSRSPVSIPLDPAETPQNNIEDYFRRHRKGREGLEQLLRRREISEQELTELEGIIDSLTADWENASQRYRSEIAALLPRQSEPGKPQAAAERLPYREHTLSTGVTIYIGRDGADNDRTTFEFAKPFELWFHTQQCPGSHVVMKFPNKSFEPSRKEIEETAAIAAWHSKAKNDSLVPVIYTERRYVRKPRKAKPGLVMVEREKSVMVRPKKGE